jgi:hypothetical protein
MAEHNLGPIRINPTGAYDDTKEYKFLDSVILDGTTYVCINLEYTTKFFRGQDPRPDKNESAELYWAVEALRGEQGPKADKYDEFIRVEPTEKDMIWDYGLSDKIIIPTEADLTNKVLQISNVYDGCCGMIITRNRNVILPENSDYALDFDYMNIGVKQYYMYTFVYCDKIMSTPRFIWNRTVIQGVEDLE